MPLLAAYSFDEAGTTVVDYSGNSRDWTLNNNATRTASGHTNGGLTKAGALMPVVASPAFVGASAWTMMFWRQGLGDTVWWCRLYNTAADTGSGILLLGGSLRIRIRKASNTEATATAPADGLWHHYAATYDGIVGRLYIDGTLVATTATVTAPTAAVDRIDILEHTLSNTFTDDLRFYDEALGQSTIATLMATPVTASTPPAKSGSVTLSAAATVTMSGARGTARSATLSSAAALTASGARSAAGPAQLSASAALVAGGTRAAAGSTILAAATAITSTGAANRVGVVRLSASAALRISSGTPTNIDLTAVLARQPAPAVTLGDRRWTATLEAQ